MIENTTIKASIVKPEDAKPAKIKVDELLKFNGGLDTVITDSIELADLVSSLFGGIMHDYYGCKICVNDGRANPIVAQTIPRGTLYVDLYFKYNANDASNRMRNIELLSNINKKAIEPKADIDNTDKTPEEIARERRDEEFRNKIMMMLSMNQRSNAGNMFFITKETYESLIPFMFNGANTRWNDHTQEIQISPTPYSKGDVLVRISGLSLNAILSMIYGNEVDGTNYEYAAAPHTPIPNQDEFIVVINRLDIRTVRSLQNKLGIGSVATNMFHRYTR